MILDSRATAHDFVSGLEIPPESWPDDTSEWDFAEWLFWNYRNVISSDINIKFELSAYLESIVDFKVMCIDANESPD